jgi:RNA recognition motif-containing protein
LEFGSTAEQIPRLSEDDPTKTTLVIKNFPAGYTKSMVLELLDVLGFKGFYDFAYLPVDFRTRRSFGYALVNFVTHTDALQFGQLFNGFSLWAVWSANVGIAEWSGAMQGLEKHIERYRDSPMMHNSLPDDVKPSIFKDGERMAFPRPTRPLKMPREARKSLSSSGAALVPVPWYPINVGACGTFGTRAPQASSAQRMPPR